MVDVAMVRGGMVDVAMVPCSGASLAAKAPAAGRKPAGKALSDVRYLHPYINGSLL
jgi:hypothetical protein